MKAEMHVQSSFTSHHIDAMHSLLNPRSYDCIVVIKLSASSKNFVPLINSRYVTGDYKTTTRAPTMSTPVRRPTLSTTTACRSCAATVRRPIGKPRYEYD